MRHTKSNSPSIKKTRLHQSTPRTPLSTSSTLEFRTNYTKGNVIGSQTSRNFTTMRHTKSNSPNIKKTSPPTSRQPHSIECPKKPHCIKCSFSAMPIQHLFNCLFIALQKTKTITDEPHSNCFGLASETSLTIHSQ